MTTSIIYINPEQYPKVQKWHFLKDTNVSSFDDIYEAVINSEKIFVTRFCDDDNIAIKSLALVSVDSCI